MNERIEKLIEQCTVQEFSDCTGGFETFDKDKFAQLIIRECTKLIEQSIEDDEYWSRTTGAESIMAIEEHFGVE
jgi:hypothetical protein